MWQELDFDQRDKFIFVPAATTLSDAHQRQLPGLVLECRDELLTMINYFARIKTPKKDPVFTGPREAIAT